MLRFGWACNFGVSGPFQLDNNAAMNTNVTPADNDSDFGPTVPGQRSGEGSGSILPYLANSLKVNPNAGALSLARELHNRSKPAKNTSAQLETPTAVPPVKPAKPVKPVKPVKPLK
jgi:hypothetical protein